MDSLVNSESNAHLSFKHFAEKSIGSCLSVPILHKKFKSPYGEEKFKVAVDKRVSALYVQLLENRVSKLKKEEEQEKKNREIQEKLKESKEEAIQRKLRNDEEFRKFREIKEKRRDFIREQILKHRKEHVMTMKEIKQESKKIMTELNQKRKDEKNSHMRIKSVFIETSRLNNYKKAKVIKDSIKNVETARANSKIQFKTQLRKQYIAQIEEDRKAKEKYQEKIKALESEENTLLQRLGKTHSTSI